MADEKRPVVNIRVSPKLRARVEACAAAEGMSLPEYAREALRLRCETTERVQGARMSVQRDLWDGRDSDK